jgi:hypothetical protein
MEGRDQRDLQNDPRFEQVTAAVREIVLRQVDADIEIVNDGQATKGSYTSVRHRAVQGGRTARVARRTLMSTLPRFVCYGTEAGWLHLEEFNQAIAVQA